VTTAPQPDCTTGEIAQRTIYARLPAWLSRFLLAAILGLVVLPALPHPALHIPGERQWGQPGPARSDMGLYRRVVADLENGQDYYVAAATEHRRFGYPTSPAPVFRMPTLAWMLLFLRTDFIRLTALALIYGATMVLLYRELQAGKNSLPVRVGVLAVAVTGLSVAGATDAVYWHEVWAGLLIALSLLSYRGARWWPAVLGGLAACLIREIAAPYLVVMAGFALLERRWKEVFAWIGAIVAIAAALVLHLSFASRLHQAGDIVSASWLGFGGWDFAIASAKWNILLHGLPYPLIALAICLGLVGLAGASDCRARRAAVIVGAYLMALLIVGRPDNYYWGIIFTPLLPMGWLFAPRAIRDLAASALFPSKWSNQ
jgi:hypothetical protein